MRPTKKSKSVPQKKDYGDYSNFKEYHEYLELFADGDCSLFNDLKAKEGSNAKIFKEVLMKSRLKAKLPQTKPKSPLLSQDKNRAMSPGTINEKLKKASSKNSASGFNKDSSMILSMTFKGDSYRDMHNKSNAFNPTNPNNYVSSDPKLLASKKQSPAETYFSKETTSFNKSNMRSFLQSKFPIEKKKTSILDSKDILDLKHKIVKHENDRPRFSRKEVPFQFDKSFIGSRKLQEKKFDFDRRNGLLPRTLLSVSFGK